MTELTEHPPAAVPEAKKVRINYFPIALAESCNSNLNRNGGV